MSVDRVELDELVECMRRLRDAIATCGPGVLDLLRWRIEDEELIASDDFQESLAQMQQGEGIVVRPLPPEDGHTRAAEG